MDYLKRFIGDDNSDENLSIIEDFNDSIDEENIEWRNRYEENDKNWRERYSSRFFSGEKEEVKDKGNEEISESQFDEKADLRIDDLFS